ncbi:hypothetical protein KR093_001600, partial [Drosophila rubida]
PTTTEMQLELELEQQQRIDCKLTFDAATMESLEQQRHLLEAYGCNVPPIGVTNKPADVAPQQQQELRHSRPGGSSQPLYELQLVVWPAGVEVDDDGIVPVTVAAAGSSTTPRTTTTTTTTRATTTKTPATSTSTTTPSSVAPLYEDQLVVFPQMDFEEENFDYLLDELQPAGMATSTQRPSSATTPSSKPVYVLENFRRTHPNGTEEHKLVLSNGLVNYMKHYAKRVDDKLINVQEGYSSVPVAGLKPLIQTLHYIADEHGYNIHKSKLPLRPHNQRSHHRHCYSTVERSP